MLSKLGINPIEIGLILTGVMENELIFSASDLDLDLDGFRDDIVLGTSRSFNLACEIRWFSSLTTKTLISKASSEAMSVAVEAGLVNEKTAAAILSKARGRALSLAGQLDSSALDDELNEALGALNHSAEVVNSETTDSEAPPEGEAEEEEEEEEGAEFGGLGDLFG